MKKKKVQKLAALLLAAVLLAACPLPVHGQNGDFRLELEAPATVSPGDVIDVVITIRDIRQELVSLEFFLDFDESKVAGVITKFGEDMDAFMTVKPMYTLVAGGMELPVSRYEQICIYDESDGVYECRFMDLLQYPSAKPGETYKGLLKDGDLVITIPFRVLDTVKHGDVLSFRVLDGSAKATTKATLEGVRGSANTVQVSVTASTGVTVKGSVSSDTTLELWRKGAAKASYTTVSKSGGYTLEGVEPGSYVLTASRPGYVSRSYAVTAQEAPVTQNVTLCLKGDVTADGKVNAKDVKAVYDHVKGSKRITDQYALDCADPTGDGVKIVDAAAIYAHTTRRTAL